MSVFSGVRGHNYFTMCLFTKTFFYEGIISLWNQLLKKVLDLYPLINLSYYVFCTRLYSFAAGSIFGKVFHSNAAGLCSFFPL